MPPAVKMERSIVKDNTYLRDDKGIAFFRSGVTQQTRSPEIPRLKQIVAPHNPMSTILITAAIAVVIPPLFLLYSLWNSPLRAIPLAPDADILLGHLPKVEADTGVWPRKWSQMLPFGVFRTRFIFSWRVWVTDPKALTKILVTSAYDYPKPPSLIDFLSILLGRGVLVAEGVEHKKQRRALDSAFSLQQIKDLSDMFWSPGRILSEKWKEAVPSQTESTRLDICPLLSRCTLDIIGLAGFDYNFDSMNREDDPLAKAYNILFGHPENAPIIVHIVSLLAETFPRLVSLRNGTKFIKNIVQQREIVEKITQSLLDKKRRELKEAIDNNTPHTKKDILSLLVRDNLGLEDPLTDKEITDQCLTFLAAGHETTSTALTWTLQRLADNPTVQEKLRKEILEKYPEDRNLTYDELNNSLPYLNAVVREVLRIDSPVPMTIRQSAKDDVICGYTIPKNSVIMVAPAVIHFHPDIWGPDAAEFKPERFLDNNAIPDTARTPFANLTFLAGPRNCIGQKFALAEMKALLICILRSFSFEPDVIGQHVERNSLLVMRPKSGQLHLRVKRIEGK
ncbi:cytochrome P450 [Planoprotostelium fungivorum]|uniref:Cytochrome P450 n=1 Tax=Planoprotostelium fungivorum TaxID=1890364 RepID=A0A2P6NT57_9EUKA|nr:cytochrome P450 [Planoprotostelium fungivorum]